MRWSPFLSSTKCQMTWRMSISLKNHRIFSWRRVFWQRPQSLIGSRFELVSVHCMYEAVLLVRRVNVDNSTQALYSSPGFPVRAIWSWVSLVVMWNFPMHLLDNWRITHSELFSLVLAKIRYEPWWFVAFFNREIAGHYIRFFFHLNKELQDHSPRYTTTKSTFGANQRSRSLAE